MDPYVPLFQEQGASLVMLAKGNRSPVVTESCKTFGGFYLGSIGGPAARLGKECITAVHRSSLIPELGMEAIYRDNRQGFPGLHHRGRQGKQLFRRTALIGPNAACPS
jgi:fumarate hydratase, class I